MSPHSHLVIGIGSPFGDDRAGWAVIEQLNAMPLPPGMDLLDLDRPGPTLIEKMQGYDTVTLIDAVQTDEHPPGTCLELTPERLASLPPVSSHGFGLAHTLQLASTLTQLPPRLHLLGLCMPTAPSISDDLSLEMQAGVLQLALKLSGMQHT